MTFGWGVVFSDQTVDNLIANDPVSAADHRRRIRPLGRYRGPYRRRMPDLVGPWLYRHRPQALARSCCRRAPSDLGVALHYEAECDPDPAAWADYDLVIAADGINSRIRDARADAFGVEIEERANKFIWLGTPKTFDAFTFAFEQTEAGWIWAHAYRFAADCSTFIVECSPRPGPGSASTRWTQAAVDRALRAIFARYLDGQPLLSNAAHLPGAAAWLNFRRIKCERWSDGKIDPDRRRRA